MELEFHDIEKAERMSLNVGGCVVIDYFRERSNEYIADRMPANWKALLYEQTNPSGDYQSLAGRIVVVVPTCMKRFRAWFLLNRLNELSGTRI